MREAGAATVDGSCGGEENVLDGRYPAGAVRGVPKFIPPIPGLSRVASRIAGSGAPATAVQLPARTVPQSRPIPPRAAAGAAAVRGGALAHVASLREPKVKPPAPPFLAGSPVHAVSCLVGGAVAGDTIALSGSRNPNTIPLSVREAQLQGFGDGAEPVLVGCIMSRLRGGGAWRRLCMTFKARVVSFGVQAIASLAMLAPPSKIDKRVECTDHCLCNRIVFVDGGAAVIVLRSGHAARPEQSHQRLQHA